MSAHTDAQVAAVLAATGHCSCCPTLDAESVRHILAVAASVRPVTNTRLYVGTIPAQQRPTTPRDECP